MWIIDDPRSVEHSFNRSKRSSKCRHSRRPSLLTFRDLSMPAGAANVRHESCRNFQLTLSYTHIKHPPFSIANICMRTFSCISCKSQAYFVNIWRCNYARKIKACALSLFANRGIILLANNKSLNLHSKHCFSLHYFECALPDSSSV